MEAGGSSNGSRSRDKRSGSAKRTERTEKTDKTERIERAAGAKVDLGVLPKLLGYNLRRANQASWRTYVSFIGENKIRPGLFSLLCLVRFNAGIAQIELGTHLGVDKASIVALLDRLERAGLIERRRSTRDRRRQGISLTQAGESEVDSLMMQVRQLERHMASRFNKQELDQFLTFLHRMYE
ncbi:MAG TPA: MarR family winged helix-turn-helix transcriptional regulator [Steroidobacteraceae bacterium]|jgi:DNA-binding MarR family transcriptional regulator|nr:MarR family winged helix-turn-helix transcriptional regulator [Steroidobacteraceae bacterium]